MIKSISIYDFMYIALRRCSNKCVICYKERLEVSDKDKNIDALNGDYKLSDERPDVIPPRRRRKNDTNSSKKKKRIKPREDNKTEEESKEVSSEASASNGTSETNIKKVLNKKRRRVADKAAKDAEAAVAVDDDSADEAVEDVGVDSIFDNPEEIDSALESGTDIDDEPSNMLDQHIKDDEEDEDDTEEESTVKPKKRKNKKEHKKKKSDDSGEKSIQEQYREFFDADDDDEEEKSFPIFRVLLAIVVVIAAGVVVTGQIYFSSHWYKNTTLNGENVEMLTLDETISKFNQIYDNYTLTIKGRNDMSVEISKDDVDLEVEAEKFIREQFEKQHKTFYVMAFFEDQNLFMEPEAEYDKDKYTEILTNSVLLKGTEDQPIVAPRDACAALDDEKGYFVVKPEEQGYTLNQEEFFKVANDAIDKTLTEVNLDDSDKYPDMFAKPKITSDADGLQEACDTYNKTVLHWINWKMTNDVTISVTPQDIKEWYVMDDDFNVTLDEAKLEKYIENFCLKYKTVGRTRKFKTHSGSEISISGGDYGWQMDYDKTLQQVKDILNADSSAATKAYLENPNEETKAALTSNLDTVYKSKGYKFAAAEGEADWNPSNYSEISISEQMVYVYKDGKQVYSAHCITGLPTPERETTKGVWYVKERLRNKTLTGPGYSTPVSYWVRITWSGIGYHDATWQSWGSWNANKYKSVGSHGCINLSMTDVSNIYDLVAVGDAVFIY